MAPLIATNILDTVMTNFMVKMEKKSCSSEMILEWSAGCMTCQRDGGDSALLALLSSDLQDEANREVSMQILTTFVLSSVDFQPPLSAAGRNQWQHKLYLALSSFWQKTIKICTLNSERFRNWCRCNLRKNQTNKMKQNSLLLFDTRFWMSAQSQLKLTWWNLSADSGRQEHGPPASQWKNMRLEIKNDCSWGKEEEKEALTWQSEITDNKAGFVIGSALTTLNN